MTLHHIDTPVNATSEPQESLPWVLHVDDDAEYSASLRRRLEVLGVAVVQAVDGWDGCHCALMYPADAVLLDVQMPNGRGEDVLHRLKASRATAKTPVIVLSSMKSIYVKRKFLALGAVKYLTKDAPFQDLVKELARHIDVLDAENHVEASARAMR